MRSLAHADPGKPCLRRYLLGEKVPSLKSLDSAGLVIHQGSASKAISPALRLGWLVAPRAAIDLLGPAKASLDLSTPALAQAVLAGFLNSGAYARHLPKFRDQLRVRRDALIAALAAHCPELRYAKPQGLSTSGRSYRNRCSRRSSRLPRQPMACWFAAGTRF